MIPKRAMFFWAGGPLSWMRFNTLWSFRKLHPDWEMWLFYGGAMQPESELSWKNDQRQDWLDSVISPDYLPHLGLLNVEIKPWRCPAEYLRSSPLQMNDLCRWGALSKFGGWFFDLDFLFVDSMSQLNEKAHEDGVSIVLAKDWIPTGFMGASADNQFTATMYRAAMQNPDRRSYYSAGSDSIARTIGFEPSGYFGRHTGHELASALRRTFPEVAWHFLSRETAYRYDWHEVNMVFGSVHNHHRNTIAMHWYGGSRSGQRWQRKMTEQNYTGFENNYCVDVARLAEATAV